MTNLQASAMLRLLKQLKVRMNIIQQTSTDFSFLNHTWLNMLWGNHFRDIAGGGMEAEMDTDIEEERKGHIETNTK